MGNVILFILSLVPLTTLPATAVDNQWTENIRKFIEKVNISGDAIWSMTRSMFDGMEQNCGYAINKMNRTYILTPPLLNDPACDMELYNYLKRGLEEPSSFDSEYFLRKLWESDYGVAFLKSLKEKGVDEIAAKGAVKELWFTQAGGRDTAFNRLFYGRGNKGKNDVWKRNSWYTYSIPIDPNECIFSGNVNSLPMDLDATCLADEDQQISSFIYPNHPFMDIIIYSLSAWRNDYGERGLRNVYTSIDLPGSKTVFRVRAWFHTNEDKSTYLYNVVMGFSYQPDNGTS